MFGTSEKVVARGAQRVHETLAAVETDGGDRGHPRLATSVPEDYMPRFVAAVADRCGLDVDAVGFSRRRCSALARAMASEAVDEAPAIIAAAAIAIVGSLRSAKHTADVAVATGVRANALKRCIRLGSRLGAQTPRHRDDGGGGVRAC